jgi:hypothetical protein
MIAVSIVVQGNRAEPGRAAVGTSSQGRHQLDIAID